MRITCNTDPFFAEQREVLPYSDASFHPGAWLHFQTECAVFRLQFQLNCDCKVTIHASFNECGELYLDGQLLERGPYRSDPKHHRYFSHELELAAGSHQWFARAWALGKNAPWGVMSAGTPGFLLVADGEFCNDFSTGLAPWETSPVDGLTFDYRPEDLYIVATGAVNCFDLDRYGKFDWRPAGATGKIYSTAHALHYNNSLYLESADLPQQRSHTINTDQMKIVATGSGAGVPFQDFVLGGQCDRMPRYDRFCPLTVPAGKQYFVLVDFNDYHAFYYDVTVRGRGGRLSVEFCESLFDDFNGTKENRDRVSGQCWHRPHGDVFYAAAASRTAMPVYLRCGRWMMLKIAAGPEPFTLESIRFFATGYPLTKQSKFSADPDYFSEMTTVMMRTVELCTHEYTMDCPFYEQLMYIGDTRVINLILLAVTGDDRLPWNAAALFDYSRDFRGLTASSYPARGRQAIPPYSLLHIAMLHDCVMWTARGPQTVAKYLPGMRAIIEFYESCRDQPTQLLISPPGWNYIDACYFGKWAGGAAPDGEPGKISGVNNLLYDYILGYAIALEDAFGDRFMADRYRWLRQTTRDAVKQYFWVEDKKLFADNFEQTEFSEHAQIFAILSGIPGENALFETGQTMARATYYFSHYYFECCQRRNRMDRFMERYQQLAAGIRHYRLLTTPEGPGNTRSDCHAWSSSMLFHFYATVAGIRSAAPGFQKITVSPQLHDLQQIRGSMIHPEGGIDFDIKQPQPGRLTGCITLPGGISGELYLDNKVLPLSPGPNCF